MKRLPVDTAQGLKVDPQGALVTVKLQNKATLKF